MCPGIGPSLFSSFVQATYLLASLYIVSVLFFFAELLFAHG